MTLDSFGARGELRVGDAVLPDLAAVCVCGTSADVDRLPYSIKILLENLLRHEDGESRHRRRCRRPGPMDPGGSVVRGGGLHTRAGAAPGLHRGAGRGRPGRASRRPGGSRRRPGARKPRGSRRARHRPLGHRRGVGELEAFAVNAAIEHERNVERYRLLRWAQQAFERFVVVPPDTGICHQVNLEYLARVVFATDDGEAFPDTLVGTDSHTPMVNGLGVLGWGVGGIEAEAAMLGQSLPCPCRRSSACSSSASCPRQATATDLVLTMAELLRRHGVVGKFVEFTGPGLSEPSGRASSDARQHGARVRRHLCHQPDRRA